MKTRSIVLLIVAGALILVGTAVALGAVFSMNLDFREMNTMTFTEKTYNIDEAFDSISVDGVECDVLIIPSTDSECRVVCNESDKITHTVEVENGTLTVKRYDQRKWYQRMGIYWGKMEIKVYLPEGDYSSLDITTLSGNVEVPEGYSFGEAEIYNTSGNVSISAAVKGTLSVKTVSGEQKIRNAAPEKLNLRSTSGDIEVSSANSVSDIKLETVSGSIEIEDAVCRSITAASTSGEITLESVTAEADIDMKTTSGEVELNRSDAASLKIVTVSGDVSGTLLTEKAFITDTVSGDVNVPRTASENICDIKTTSGSIDFEVISNE